MTNIYKSGYLDKTENTVEKDISEIIKKISVPDFSDQFGKAVTIFNTVIISDIHLGSKVSRARVLLDFLERVTFKRLIINGDVFDSINMKRLNRYHWKVLSKLRQLTDKENHIEVIWIRGNHDGFSDLLTQLLGIQVFTEFEFEWGSQKILVFHGDIFDKFTTNYPLVSEIADWIYRLSMRIDPSRMRIGRWLKRNSKTFIRNTQRVREGAVKYAKTREARIVVCGHTHHVEDTHCDGIRYLNPGSWTDAPSCFVGITESHIAIAPYL